MSSIIQCQTYNFFYPQTWFRLLILEVNLETSYYDVYIQNSVFEFCVSEKILLYRCSATSILIPY